ncbi:MAG TPA: hypothetical protein VKR57_11200 [Terriglobales bacterium]|nr:hypothetical protein [Terriglobales bacterium]
MALGTVWAMVDAGLSATLEIAAATRYPVMLLTLVPANDGGTFPGFD